MALTLTDMTATPKEDEVPKQHRRRRSVISDKPGQKKRQKGVRKELVGFRCPDEMLNYLNSRTTPSIDRTEVILKLLQISRDAGDALGLQWWEVEKRANAHGLSPGTVLGELALEALTGKKPKK